MNKKVLIIGGVAGGASTAARLRRLDETAEIIMFEKGEFISFANCGLPYYIGGTIKERKSLLLQTPEAFNKRFNVDVRVFNEVTKINRKDKTVNVYNHLTKENYIEKYDTLVLSPGSTPIKPPIEGINSPNIFSLWNIPDVDKIKNYVEENSPKKAVVVGGGFIGIEMAENLHDLGMDVSLIDMQDQIMAPIDFEMAQILHDHMNTLGVNLFLKEAVEKFEYDSGITTIKLKSGKELDADIVIFSIGIKPQSKLAIDSGLDTNKRGGIIVDEFLKTSDENIYALGDAIEVIDYINKGKTMIPLAGPANKQGRICANNIAGIKTPFKGTQGTSVAKVFEMTVASTGKNEKQLQQEGKVYGKDYFVSLVIPKSHAGYYPGAMSMTLKVIFDNQGKIIGAQNVGYEGVEKRIDVIATVIRFNGSIYDLEELELSYAPPYSSAKDPVNMAGFVGENIATKHMNAILAREIEDAQKDENTIIIDVREDVEVISGKIDGAMHIPVDSLRSKLSTLDKNKKYVIYCAVGIRGYAGSRILIQNGFNNVFNLLGGYTHYKTFISKYDIKNTNHNTKNTQIEDKKKDIKNMECKTIEVDACGLQCPGPILEVYKAVNESNVGDVVKVKATDPGFYNDIIAWCERTGNTLLESSNNGREINVSIQKGEILAKNITEQNSGTSMVVFSGDLDKALAALIIANGAAAMGQEVTLFFTFWGLNILRRKENIKVKKDFMGTMFGKMMPQGSEKLALSKMNMFGMGAKMIKGIMKKNNVSSIDELIESALGNGVKLVACNMSMDLMGIKEEELIDGVELGGVAAFIGSADKSNINMFIS